MRIIILLALACASPAFAQPQEESTRLLAVSDELKRQAQILRDIATDDQEQPWFCEDYEAEGEAPAKGCVRERDMIPVSRGEWESIERRLCGQNGSVSRDEDGPVCDEDESRRLLCTGPTETIADDDPGLELFLSKYPNSLEDRKVALAIERENSCD